MSRIRVVTHIGRDGVTHSEEVIEEDASIVQRFAELAESAHQAAGPGVMFMWVVCNGCERREAVKRPALPDGWVSTPDGEFCPGCRQ